MTFTAKSLVAGLILCASTAMATQATDPDVIARQELMKTIGANTKILGDTAAGKAEFDATKTAEAQAALVEASDTIGARFEPQATDPESEAKPEIWQDWSDFLTKVSALNTAAAAMDTASAANIAAGMQTLGGACKDCHTTYRVQN